MLNDHFQRKLRAAQMRIVLDALTDDSNGCLPLRDLRALLEPREYRQYTEAAQSLEKEGKRARQEEPDLSPDGQAYLEASRKVYEQAKKLGLRRSPPKTIKAADARKRRERDLRERVVDLAHEAKELYEALCESDKYKFRSVEIEDRLYDRSQELEIDLPILKDPLDDNPQLRNWQRTAQIETLRHVIDMFDPRTDDAADSDRRSPKQWHYIQRILNR